MPRIYEPYDEYRHGKLVIKALPSSCVEVFYEPSREKLELSDMDPEKAYMYRVRLLEIDNKNGHLTIMPINTRGGRSGFLKPKYTQIKRITLADGKPVISVSEDDSSSSREYFRSLTFGSTKPINKNLAEEEIVDAPASENEIIEILESLPPTFTKNYDYGLGLAKPYRFIIDAVEEHSNCTQIVIAEQHHTETDEQKKSSTFLPKISKQ